jgi:hypothetical protein
LKEGKVIHEGSMESLREETPVYEVSLEPWDGAREFLELNGVTILAPGRIALAPDADPAILVAALVGCGVRVSAFAPVRRSLEDLYFEMTSRPSKDTPLPFQPAA